MICPGPRQNSQMKRIILASLKDQRVGIRAAVITAIGSLFAALIVGIFAMISGRKLSTDDSARSWFELEKSILRPDAAVVIVAKHSAVERKDPLDVMFDDVVIPLAGVPDSSSSVFAWVFNPLAHFPKEFLADGPHALRVAFSQKPFSRKMSLLIHSKSTAPGFSWTLR